VSTVTIGNRPSIVGGPAGAKLFPAGRLDSRRQIERQIAATVGLVSGGCRLLYCDLPSCAIGSMCGGCAMRSTRFVCGLLLFSGLVLTVWATAPAATPVGKVLKKVQEDARREDAKEPSPKPEEKPAVKQPVRVTISKETTYITSPLRPDGYPDYVAAIDAMAARGVTPENNAFVLLVQALGPKAISEACRKPLYAKLRIPPLREDARYFVDYDECAKKARGDPDDSEIDTRTPIEQDEQLDGALRAPWTEKDRPFVAAWLKANAAPLSLAVQASTRPKYYRPMVARDGDQGGFLDTLSAVHAARYLAKALVAGAMLHLGHNDIDGACRDLLACRRMARLIGQGPTVIELLIAGTVDREALCGERALFHVGMPTASQLRSFRTEREKLARMPRFLDKLVPAERFFYLDEICGMARRGSTSLELTYDGSGRKESFIEAFKHWAICGPVDWNAMLRQANSYYDRLEGITRTASYEKRKEQMTQMQKEADEVRGRAFARYAFLRNPLRLDPHRIGTSEEIGSGYFALILSALSMVHDAEARSATAIQLNDIALALALYRAERGAYPERLEQLVPKYVAEMPKDLYSGAAIRYKREGTGYLLYSLGPNGKDDGGRGRFMDPPPGEEEEVPEDADDIGFRMPSLDKPAGKKANDAAKLKSKIDALAQPLIENKTAVGFAVGIVHDGRAHVFGYGRVSRDSQQTPDGKTVYEIGSITKIFTGLLLADAVERKLVALDDPVAKYLPAEVKVPQKDGRAITLLDLATHTSGLPRLPDNLLPQIDKHPHNPYAQYTVDDLYNFLSAHKLGRTPGEEFEYSNLGAGLLGHALARRAGKSYEEIVVDRICLPLGMKETRIALGEAMRRRLAPGHNAAGKPESNWDIPTLAGGGALRSTADDMLLFMAGNLRPDFVGRSPTASSSGRSGTPSYGANDVRLAAAIRLSHVPRRDIGKDARIAFGWHIRTKEGIHWHNGQTGGYHSYLGLHPASGSGVVVLSNSATGAIDELGVKLLKLIVAEDK
jgi:CubicO group peptidase (beta-lactamase class C family)